MWLLTHYLHLQLVDPRMEMDKCNVVNHEIINVSFIKPQLSEHLETYDNWLRYNLQFDQDFGDLYICECSSWDELDQAQKTSRAVTINTWNFIALIIWNHYLTSCSIVNQNGNRKQFEIGIFIVSLSVNFYMYFYLYYNQAFN